MEGEQVHVALPASWQTMAMPQQVARLKFEKHYTADEYGVLARGLIPQMMEDHWFICLQDGSLKIYRSWSGFCIYEVAFEKSDGGYAVREALVNRNTEQYESVDDRYDSELVSYLIDSLLLGKEVPFPMHSESNAESPAIALDTAQLELPGVESKRRAGHYEILGETYAKFEFFENGWNPYSRFLDVDKVDLILRRVESGKRIYREVQVKYGKLHKVGTAWEKRLFDVTSWRFFKEDEFAGYVDRGDFFVAYVLAADIGYAGDIFIFPIADFARLLKCGISSKGQRKIYVSRLRDQADRWILRRVGTFSTIDDSTCIDVSKYRRNFTLLRNNA